MFNQRRVEQPKISTLENLFPVLKPPLMGRLAAQGHTRSVQRDEILVAPGTKSAHFRSGDASVVFEFSIMGRYPAHGTLAPSTLP
jgi:hypothetical protein